jgi:peptidoglycan biosynthesis protein MviN/MurJ (putative lipid II flippase)
VLSVCGADIVALVYGRTRLDAAQVSEIGTCLALVSIGLAAWAAQAVVARGFYALGNTWMPALLGTAVAVLAYPLYVFARTEWGVRGLALASSCAIVTYTLLLWWRLDRRFSKDVSARESLMPFLVRALITLGTGIGAGKLCTWLLPDPERAPAVAAHALLISCAVLAAFTVAARWVGLSEVGALWSRLSRRAPAPSARV